MTSLSLQDSCVALVTPFHNDGTIDEDRLQSFYDWQINQGTSGLVPVGTTGESPTLSHSEHERVIERHDAADHAVTERDDVALLSVPGRG